jgi:hypothetical protein
MIRRLLKRLFRPHNMPIRLDGVTPRISGFNRRHTKRISPRLRWKRDKALHATLYTTCSDNLGNLVEIERAAAIDSLDYLLRAIKFPSDCCACCCKHAQCTTAPGALIMGVRTCGDFRSCGCCGHVDTVLITRGKGLLFLDIPVCTDCSKLSVQQGDGSAKPLSQCIVSAHVADYYCWCSVDDAKKVWRRNYPFHERSTCSAGLVVRLDFGWHHLKTGELGRLQIDYGGKSGFVDNPTRAAYVREFRRVNECLYLGYYSTTSVAGPKGFMFG